MMKVEGRCNRGSGIRVAFGVQVLDAVAQGHGHRRSRSRVASHGRDNRVQRRALTLSTEY